MKNTLRKFISLLKKNQNKLLLVIFLGVVIFRVWLATGIPKLYYYGPYDDLFFSKAALSIIRGTWMGAYDQFTLIKGPFYSFFLIISFLSGLPLYLNETIFYVVGCIILYFALKPLIKNSWWRLVIFIFVLFTPNSLAIWMHLRVHREFVYYSLTLYVTAFATGLLLRFNAKPKNMLFWSLGLGLSMSAFLLTREEGVWIYPILGLFFLIYFIKIWRQKKNKPILRSLMVLLPIPIWFLPILLVSYLNYSHYGFWGVSEQLAPQFNRVLNTLARIESGDTWHPAIQISGSDRSAAYEASPTLKKFEPLIEKKVKEWDEVDEFAMSAKPDWYLAEYGDAESEISNGLFLWVFRDAISQKGFYNDGTYPKELYQQIGDELEGACDSGVLNCERKSILPAMVGSIDLRHIPIILRMLWENIIHTIRLDLTAIYPMDIDHYWPAWPDGNDEYALFDQFSYNPVDVVETVRNDNIPRNIDGVTDLRYRAMIKKGKIMVGITDLYRSILLPVSFIAAVNWLVLMFTTIFAERKSRYSSFAIISSLILLFYLGRLTTLTIVDATTSIPGLYYSFSTQIPLVAFTAIMLVWGIYFLKDKNVEKGKRG